ncbi:hypothetical protein VF21_08950 [Pseudogymnoascus sp. 05NY08]|nr:hypothetical protein VF21_08950 [Pseudogymnoascus sp. 05NY08]
MVAATSGGDITRATNTSAIIACMVVATAFVPTRVVVRWKAAHGFGLDDYFCWAALVFYLAYSGLYFSIFPEIYTFQDITEGKIQRPPDFGQQYTKMLLSILATNIMFWTALWCVKISMLLMFRRLIERVGSIYRRIWYGVLILTVVVYIIAVISGLVSCGPFHNYKIVGKCATQEFAQLQLWSLYFGLASDVTTDLLSMPSLLSCLRPLTLIHSHVDPHLPYLEPTDEPPPKISTGISFCAGFTTIIVAFIRVFTLHANRSSQINISWLAFWATIEGCIAICVNCISAFAFLVRNKIHDSRDRKAANSNSAGYAQMGSGSRRKADGGDGGVLMAPMGRGKQGTPGDAHRAGRYVANTYPADSKVLDGIFAEVLAEPEDVLPRALELACEITKEVSSMAAYLNRQLIWRGAGTAEEAHLVDSPILFEMFGGRDHLEAKRAFFKKEKPNFVYEVENDAPRAYPWCTELNVDLKPKAARRADSKI